MGSEQFTTAAKGKTAAEAFTKAVGQAQYDWGHSGYTGSIAEKDDYIMVSDTKMTVEAATELADKMLDDDHPSIADKWGPAGCIALEADGYLFFGWASS